MSGFWKFIKGAFLFLMFVIFVALVARVLDVVREAKEAEKPVKDGVLKVDIRGIIMDGKRPLKVLRKYASDPHVKGLLVQIDSPGGVVGPSQELNAELRRVREEYKKPVVAVSSGVMASGAYYAAVAADKIFVNPGTMVGSIGVIMELANLEKLYEWAKVKRYVVKTGAYKDTGAEYRPLRPDEEKYLQTTINEVLEQFKAAVAEGRKMKPEAVAAVADGRIFNGAKALELGLVDAIGTYTDAKRAIGEMTGLGPDVEIFEPPKERPSILEFLQAADDGEEDDMGSRAVEKLFQIGRLDLAGKPLFLMPGVWDVRN